MATSNPFPIMPPKSTELRLMSFDEYVYTATPSTVLYRYMDALCGTTGAGALVNEIFLARLTNALETVYFNDLDYIFGKISFLARSPAESYSYNPMTDMLTADQWDEVRTKDAWYRARIKDFFVACSLGGTPDGVRMCVQAALAVDCDIYEVWRYVGNFGITADLGRAPIPALNEMVVRPHKGSLAPAEIRLVRDMLGKICPMDTIVTVTLDGLAVQAPIPVNAAASDSEYFEVQRVVTATPAMANLPSPSELPITLSDSEAWLYNAQDNPTQAPYSAFNMSSEYGYYYLVGGGNRSPIDSVTYGTINTNPPVIVTVYEMQGTFTAAGSAMSIPPSSWFSGVDPTYFRWISVPYSVDTYPMEDSVSDGHDKLIGLINATPGPFVLAGFSTGALIISNVYDEIRSGSLTSRQGDFLGGVALGNPRRQVNTIAPKCTDPGGHGIYADNLLTTTESKWWEFAIPQDLATTTGDDQKGQDEATIFDTLYANYTGDLTTLTSTAELAGIPSVMLRLQNDVDLFFGYNNASGPHFQYNTYQPSPGDSRSCTKIALDYISALKLPTVAAFQTILENTPAQQVTVYEVGDASISQPSWLSQNIDPNFRYIWVPWPGTNMLPLVDSVARGVENLTTFINQNQGKFLLAGTGLGAMVTSLVYDQLHTGSLIHRRADFLAGVSFGNPRREATKIFPGGVDPGGHGINNTMLSGTESLWWEFANGMDILSSTVTGGVGTLTSSIWDAFLAEYVGDPNLITAQFSTSATTNAATILAGIINVVFNEGAPTAHTSYGVITPISGDVRTGLQIARDYLNTFVSSGVTEVLAAPDPMTTYRPSANYQTFQTSGQYTSPTPYEKADSSDNFPGGKYGIHPDAAPALNPDGSAYIFPWTSQAAYVSAQVLDILARGGLANATTYQLPLSAVNSSAKVFYPQYAIAYYPPAKDTTVSTSITGRHGDPSTQITTEPRDPTNFVRSS